MTKDEMLIEATRYWKHAEAIHHAEDFDRLRNLLADFFRHQAEQLREQAFKLSPPQNGSEM